LSNLNDFTESESKLEELADPPQRNENNPFPS